MRVLPIQQRGPSLVQFIVGLLLLGSSLIGVAAIYVMLDNLQRGSVYHQRAVKLAQQIAVSIRESSTAGEDFQTGLGLTCNSRLSKLNATSNSVACWQDLVEEQLTNGSARISLDTSTVPAQYVIMVSWSEPRTGTASYVLRVTPGSTKSDPVATRAAD